jgi:hypothetical protein
MRFKGEWVDELGGRRLGGGKGKYACSKIRKDVYYAKRTHVCIYVFWERVDVRGKVYLVKRKRVG